MSPLPPGWRINQYAERALPFGARPVPPLLELRAPPMMPLRLRVALHLTAIVDALSTRSNKK